MTQHSTVIIIRLGRCLHKLFKFQTSLLSKRPRRKKCIMSWIQRVQGSNGIHQCKARLLELKQKTFKFRRSHKQTLLRSKVMYLLCLTTWTQGTWQKILRLNRLS